MCGIAGFNWADEALGAAMGECLKHRGPDSSGVFVADGVTLAHRRLAIIDLSHEADQPMSDHSGELVIVFNGEIYNYKELRAELKGRYHFRTQSDTEVILAGYRQWGTDVVRRLNGIFAFALWDRRSRRLFLARDQMGVKPLYYAWDSQKLIFASEVKAILTHDVSRSVDPESFNSYLRVLYVPSPQTMMRGVSKLPPGHTLVLEGSTLLVQEYYRPQVTRQSWSYNAAQVRVREVIHESVGRQLMADVPVGVYLSGGIDSSIVLKEASEAHPHIKTFSIGFDLDDEEEPEKFNRDFDLAAETARYFGAGHHPLRITAEDVAENLEEIIGSVDDPISNPTAIPMAFLSKFAKRDVTVVLSGNGGDELFGGYERYRMGRRVDMLRSVPGAGHLLPERIRQAMKMSSLDRLAQFEFEKDRRLGKVVAPSVLKPLATVKTSFGSFVDNTSDRIIDLMMADLRLWLPDQALMLGDKMSMQGSVEERVPFLDREVVNLCLSLPLSYKVTPWSTKKVLKDAYRSSLPKQLFREPKRGWFSPGAKWLRRPAVQTVVKQILNSGYYEPTASLFDWAAVEQMLNDHIEKREYNLTVLWMILTFQIWAKKYETKL